MITAFVICLGAVVLGLLLSSLHAPPRRWRIGDFLQFTLPLIRRIWPRLIAEDIVSVQPMTAPVGGIVFYGRHTLYRRSVDEAISKSAENLRIEIDRHIINAMLIEDGKRFQAELLRKYPK